MKSLTTEYHNASYQGFQTAIVRIGTCINYSLAAAALIASMLLVFVFWMPHDLSRDAAITFLLTGLAIIGWTLTPIPDSVVAIGAALGLVLTGALPEEQFYAALGTELVWLLISAFVIAAAIRSSGLSEVFASKVIQPVSSVNGLFHALTLVVSATAFLVPSTSGRAALLLPVFLSLAPVMPTQNLLRALALLFPSVILLSAGGSLIGAGAHFIAVETIRSSTGHSISFVDWILLALPAALLASHGATFLILLLFVPKEERRLRLNVQTISREEKITPKQKRLLGLLAILVAAWMSNGFHGLGIALIGCLGAAVVVTPVFTDESPKALFRHVETELLVFLASTWMIAQAVVSTGKAKWFAETLLHFLPIELLQQRELVILVIVGVALTAHLLINSRSARAAVLIPSLALPLSEFGHNTATLVMATVLGTGYCQTMIASAKPIAIFRAAGDEHFDQKDLIKLAVPLLPLKFCLIAGFAIFVWPEHGTSTVVEETSLVSRHGTSRIDDESTGDQSLQMNEDQTFMPGALCTRHEMETLILGTIYHHGMWAAGWWHVWDRLRKDDVPVEKSAVKEIYRSQDMVRLRAHSPGFATVDLEPSVILNTKITCSGHRIASTLPGTRGIPVPRSKP